MKAKNLFLVKKNFSFFRVAVIMSLLVVNAAFSYAQVTVGSNSVPNATLDVVGQAGVTTVTDGVIAPRLSGVQLQAKDGRYGTDQTGAIVYVIAPLSSSTSAKTLYVTSIGYYYFDGEVWQGLKPTALNVTPVQAADYVAKVTDDVILLDWQISGYKVKLTGSAENTPVGKIVHISNVGSRGGSIDNSNVTLRNNYHTIEQTSDYAFRYIGNNMWISMTSY